MRILRPLRVLAYRESHLKLLALPVYKQFGATMLREHPFHHISHHHYLRQGLTVRQRVQYVYQHYAFDRAGGLMTTVRLYMGAPV